MAIHGIQPLGQRPDILCFWGSWRSQRIKRPGPIFHAHHREATVASTKTGAKWAPLTGFCLRHFFKVRSDRQRTILRKAKAIRAPPLKQSSGSIYTGQVGQVIGYPEQNAGFRPSVLCFFWSDLREKMPAALSVSVSKNHHHWAGICLAPPIISNPHFTGDHPINETNSLAAHRRGPFCPDCQAVDQQPQVRESMCSPNIPRWVWKWTIPQVKRPS